MLRGSGLGLIPSMWWDGRKDIQSVKSTWSIWELRVKKDSLHARMNNHYEAQIYREKKNKKIKSKQDGFLERT